MRFVLDMGLGSIGKAGAFLAGLSVAVILSLSLAGQAMAQEAASTDGASSEPSEETTRVIEEIIVTATKREESLRDIPASISVFSSADLEEQGKLGLQDFLEQSPGVTMNSQAPGNARIIIRGITTDSGPVSFIPSAVGTFIGDTSFTDPFITNIVPDLSAFDLAAVEVLKGPQGTIFGGSALAGAIRYILNQPGLEEVETRGFYQTQIPSDGTVANTYGVALNVPLIEDMLAVRGGYVSREYSGAYDDVRSGEKDVNEGAGEQFRGIIRFQPWADFDLTLTHIHQDYAAKDGLALSNFRDRRAQQSVLIDQPIDNEFDLNTARIDYDMGFAQAVYLFSHTNRDSYILVDATQIYAYDPPQGFPEEAATFLYHNNISESWSHELRFKSPDDQNFKWLIGFYYFDYEMFYELNIATVGGQQAFDALASADDVLALLNTSAEELSYETAILYARADATSEETALFLDTGYTFWDSLTLNLGARFYRTGVDGHVQGKGAGSFATGTTDYNFQQDIEEEGINPKFTAKYDLNDDVSFYFQAARGFRFGGVQTVPSSEANGVPPTYKSDSLWNYELGTRTSWLGGSLHADLTLFKIYLTDPQIDQVTPTTGLSYRDNVSAAESEGFEASLFWLTPLEGLSLSLVGGVTEAYITEEFENSDGTIVKPGTQLPGAADYQYTATASYLGQLFQQISYASYLTYSYVGPSYGDIIHSEEIFDYGEISAGVTFSAAFKRLNTDLSLNVKNITDEVGQTRGTRTTTAGGATVRAFLQNAPRTFSARLGLRF